VNRAPEHSNEVALVRETELGGHVREPLTIGDPVDSRGDPDVVAVLDQCRTGHSVEYTADMEGGMAQASRESRQIKLGWIRRDRPSHVIDDPLMRSCGCTPSRSQPHERAPSL
jgi:hypothetical protein